MVATQEFFSNIEPFLDIRKILKFSDIHHQAKHHFISTQFCEIYKNKAEHKGLYEALIVPLLKCVDAEITDIRNKIGSFDPANPKYFLNIYHAIIIISGPLYAYDVNSDMLSKKDYILYRRHYASKTVKRTLLLDIVAKDYLSTYISEKLSKTYHAIEAALKEKLNEIFEYCYKNRTVWDKKVRDFQKKWSANATKS
ncbi:hypothetical protein KAX97_08210 [candidate division WOR-3 bacterium]|nr:hypothetical protein [candidate division WOR-3 bacterium]